MGVKSVQAQHEMSIAPFDTTVWNSNRSVYNLLPDSFPIYFKQTSGALIDNFKWEIFGFSRVDSLVEYQEERPIFWVKYKKPLSGFGQAYVSVRLTTTDMLLAQRMYQLNLNIYFYKVNVLTPDTVYLNKGDSFLVKAKGTWGVGDFSIYKEGVLLKGPIFDSMISYHVKTSGKYQIWYRKGFQNSPTMKDSFLIIERSKPKIKVCNQESFCNSDFELINQSKLLLNIFKESPDSIVLWKWCISGIEDSIIIYNNNLDKIIIKFPEKTASYGVKLYVTGIYGNSDTLDFTVKVEYFSISILEGDTTFIKPEETLSIKALATSTGQISWYKGSTKIWGPVIDSVSEIPINLPGVYIAKLQTVSGVVYDTCVVVLSNGNYIVEKDKNNILIYPNPVKDKLFISSNILLEDVSIFNLIGEKVLNTNQLEIDISSLSKGIYIVTCITSDNKILNKKVIIE